MKSARRTIPAGEFKARCLRLLDEVAETGEVLVVTKRGRAVAQVAPVDSTPRRSLRGSVEYRGDIVGPFHEEWESSG